MEREKAAPWLLTLPHLDENLKPSVSDLCLFECRSHRGSS